MSYQIQCKNIGFNTMRWQFGDRVIVKDGVFLYKGTRVEDDVFDTNATFANDKFPHSKCNLGFFPMANIGTGAFVWAVMYALKNNDSGFGEGERGSSGYPLCAGTGDCDGQLVAGSWLCSGWQ